MASHNGYLKYISAKFIDKVDSSDPLGREYCTLDIKDGGWWLVFSPFYMVMSADIFFIEIFMVIIQISIIIIVIIIIKLALFIYLLFLLLLIYYQSLL